MSENDPAKSNPTIVSPPTYYSSKGVKTTYLIKEKMMADNDTIFDDSFVVRRAMPAPGGDRDAVEEEDEQRRSNSRVMPSSSRTNTTVSGGLEREGLGREEDGDDDARSLADLTRYHGQCDASGVSLHPHHGKNATTTTARRSSSSSRRAERGVSSSSDGDGRNRRRV